MIARKWYYALIQYCPDPSRLEAVNIGTLIFCPETGFLKARMTNDNRRIRKVFGEREDLHFINSAKNAILSRLQSEKFQSLNDLELYISKRANAIQFTATRPIRIVEPDTDLNSLFDKLVGQEPSRQQRISTQLANMFREAGVDGFVQHSISVEIPHLRQPVRVPFGYQNGRFNLIQPVQFSLESEELLAKAGKRAIEGQLLYESPDQTLGDLRLVVVAKFPPNADISSQDLVRDILDQHKVKMHIFEDIEPLISDIRDAGNRHHPSVAR